jgi:hypothetical protein
MGWSDSAACNDKIMFLYKPLSCLGIGSFSSIESGSRCGSDTDISSSKSGTTSIRFLQYNTGYVSENPWQVFAKDDVQIDSVLETVLSKAM